jgi:hypothetical protein
MPEQLVTVGAYSTVFEANLVKSELEAFDVSAVLADDNAITMNWRWSNAFGGVKVRVPESEVGEAHRVLALENSEDDPGLAEEVTICPVCGSDKSRAFVDKRGSFLTWLLLGVPVIPAFSKKVCGHCGARFKPNSA